MFGKIYWGIFAILYPWGMWRFYEFLENKAAEEAGNGKTYRYPCGVPFKCEGIEVPQHVNRVTDVIAPAVIVAILVPWIIGIIYVQLRRPADPADANK